VIFTLRILSNYLTSTLYQLDHFARLGVVYSEDVSMWTISSSKAFIIVPNPKPE